MQLSSQSEQSLHFKIIMPQNKMRGITEKQRRVQKKQERKLFKMNLLFKLKKPTNNPMERRPSVNQSDNLWENYKKLLYLEDSRDEILCGIHQQLANDDAEQRIQNASFHEAGCKSNSVFEQIRAVITHLPKLATYDLHLLETCVKIVDNEERRDSESLGRCTGHDGTFVAPGRPKRWRLMCLDIIKTEVAKRVAETAPSTSDLGEDRDGTGLLIRLTAARDTIAQDLKHAKALSDIFTSEWDMYDTFVMTYYENLMSQMQEKFSFDLSQTENVQILSWMIYCRDQVFNCQDAACKPCQMIAELQDKFLQDKNQHIHTWMESALQKDISDWWSDQAQPTADRLGLYTEFPIDILRMLEENINQAKNISTELYGHISTLCLEKLDTIMESYTANAKSYISQESSKRPHAGKGQKLSPTLNFKERTRKTSKGPRPTYFVQYSVALLNNFNKITNRLQQLTTQYNEAQKQVAGDSRNNNNRQLEDGPMDIEGLIRKMEAQTQECSELLLPKLFHDINPELASLLTRDWLAGNGREAVDIVCDVMTSYIRDLREPLRTWLIPRIEEMLVVGYVRGLTDKVRRINLEGKKKEHRAVSDKLCRECQQLEKFFQEFNVQDEKEPDGKGSSCWDVVREMAGVLQVGDEQTAVTDIIVLSSKYPDMTDKHAYRLLKVRGGFTKAQRNKIISSSMGKKGKTPKQGAEKNTIFSKLP